MELSSFDSQDDRGDGNAGDGHNVNKPKSKKFLIVTRRVLLGIIWMEAMKLLMVMKVELLTMMIWFGMIVYDDNVGASTMYGLTTLRAATQTRRVTQRSCRSVGASWKFLLC